MGLGILVAVWLMVLGYTLVYVGRGQVQGAPVSFQKALLGA